jgi:hypothetical protein
MLCCGEKRDGGFLFNEMEVAALYALRPIRDVQTSRIVTTTQRLALTNVAYALNAELSTEWKPHACRASVRLQNSMGFDTQGSRETIAAGNHDITSK